MFRGDVIVAFVVGALVVLAWDYYRKRQVGS